MNSRHNYLVHRHRYHSLNFSYLLSYSNGKELPFRATSNITRRGGIACVLVIGGSDLQRKRCCLERCHLQDEEQRDHHFGKHCSVSLRECLREWKYEESQLFLCRSTDVQYLNLSRRYQASRAALCCDLNDWLRVLISIVAR